MVRKASWNGIVLALSCVIFLRADVVMNEIAWMGTNASGNDEWIELYNGGSETVDLTGWKIVADDGSPEIILEGTVPAGGFFLLERVDDNTVSDIAADQIYSGSLSNTGENLKLLNADSLAVDSVDCTAEWYAGTNEPKATMERIHESLDGCCIENWAANDSSMVNGKDADGQNIQGTPKAQNSVYNPGLSAVAQKRPHAFQLLRGYPNPFNPEITFDYNLEFGGHVKLSVVDLLGRRVADIANCVQAPGQYSFQWNGRNVLGRDVSSGIYWVYLEVNGRRIQPLKVVKLK